MKIAYCLFGTFSTGGLERITTVKMNYLAEHGHEVYLITTGHLGQPSYYPLDPRIKHIDLGLNYIEPGKYHRFRLYFVNKPKYWKHEREMNRILREIQPDICIAAGWHEEEFLYRIKDGSKKIVEHHGYRYMDLDKFTLYYKMMTNPNWKETLRYKAKMIYFRWLSGRGAAKASRFDRLVCLTEADRLCYPGISHSVAIPNPLSFDENIRTIPSTLTSKIILAAGRLSGEKNFTELILIWGLIAKDYPEWKLRIVGDGNSKDDICNAAQTLNLGGQFELMPSSDDMPKLYREASICAVTSAFEGFGLVITEAESLGVPVIAYDCPCGPRSIIKDGEDGFLITPGDRINFANKLRLLIEDEELRCQMGANAIANANRFSLDNVMQQWLELFETLQTERQHK